MKRIETVGDMRQWLDGFNTDAVLTFENNDYGGYQPSGEFTYEYDRDLGMALKVQIRLGMGDPE